MLGSQLPLPHSVYCSLLFSFQLLSGKYFVKKLKENILEILALPGSFHGVVTASSVRSPAGSGVGLTPPAGGPAPGRGTEQGVSDGIFGPENILKYFSNLRKYFGSVLPRSQVCPSVPSGVSDSRPRPFL